MNSLSTTRILLLITSLFIFLSSISRASDVVEDLDIKTISQKFCFDHLIDQLQYKNYRSFVHDPLSSITPDGSYYFWKEKYKKKFHFKKDIESSTNDFCCALVILYRRIEHLINCYWQCMELTQQINKFPANSENPKIKTRKLNDGQAFTQKKIYLGFDIDALAYQYTSSEDHYSFLVDEVFECHQNLMKFNEHFKSNFEDSIRSSS